MIIEPLIENTFQCVKTVSPINEKLLITTAEQDLSSSSQRMFN